MKLEKTNSASKAQFINQLEEKISELETQIIQKDQKLQNQKEQLEELN